MSKESINDYNITVFIYLITYLPDPFSYIELSISL
jgi:hypothetical protein